MYLLEHDAKALLTRQGIPTPAGVLIDAAPALAGMALPAGPWVVKGQVAAGGRGKAGLVRKADDRAGLDVLARGILGRTFKGQTVREVRVETAVPYVAEAYVALLLDAAAGAVRVIVSASGGMDIEAVPADRLRSGLAPLEVTALQRCVRDLAATFDDATGRALAAAGERLAALFVEREALLVEINPLFVLGDGTWLAGDAKIVVDENALPRQPALAALIDERRVAYPEAAIKREHGFDYVVVDPDGEIGLLTTGAGLSMMLIDELRQQGLKPYNFLDVRTGGMRGDPTRLIHVLRWMTAGPRLRVLLINIFAGITDLAEFSRLLVTALEEVPELDVPVVARLVGNGLPAARPILAAGGVQLHTDLDAAVAEVRRLLAESAR